MGGVRGLFSDNYYNSYYAFRDPKSNSHDDDDLMDFTEASETLVYNIQEV